MNGHDEIGLFRGLERECQDLRGRPVRAERRMRWVGALLVAVVVLPFLLGAFSTKDEVVVQDAATGNVRIQMKANPNGGAYVLINAPNGARRIFLGEDGRGSPCLISFNPDGSEAQRYGP